MASVTIVFAGPPEQRHLAKVSPMSRLRDALSDACGKFKPALDPAACALALHSKPVDLDTPFRMLNLPANPRLEVQKAPAPAAAAAAAAATAAAPPAGTGAMHAPAGPQEQRQEQQQQQEPSQLRQPPQQGPAGAQPSTSAQQEQQEEQGQQVGQPAVAALEAIGITVPLHVFNQAAVEAAAAAAAAAAPEAASAGPSSSGAAPDEDDSFFEFTPEDWARMQRAAKEREKYESQFRSRGLREAEQRKHAEAFGLVPVRLHFPDRSIVQASFPATEPVASLQALVGRCLDPQLLQTSTTARPAAGTTASRAASGTKGASSGPKAYYLYTAPPKTVLKDGEAALWQAGLLPAAHVYVALDASNPAGKDFSGPYLRPEVLALMTDAVPQQQQPQQAEAAAAAAGGDDVAAAKRAHAASGQGARGEGAKLPKWFKGK